MDARGRLDRLDAALLGLLADEPRTSVLEAARRLQVARGTVQARLDRLQREGVVTGFGPDVDPEALGYPVTAFCSVEIRQRDATPAAAAPPAAASPGAPSGQPAATAGVVPRSAPSGTSTTHSAVARHLATVPEVLEAHTVTGGSDLLVRVVARSNADLQRVIDRVLESPYVVRLSTTIVLATPLPLRTMPLVRATAEQDPRPDEGRIRPNG